LCCISWSIEFPKQSMWLFFRRANMIRPFTDD